MHAEVYSNRLCFAQILLVVSGIALNAFHCFLQSTTMFASYKQIEPTTSGSFGRTSTISLVVSVSALLYNVTPPVPV